MYIYAKSRRDSSPGAMMSVVPRIWLILNSLPEFPRVGVLDEEEPRVSAPFLPLLEPLEELQIPEFELDEDFPSRAVASPTTKIA